MGQDLEEGASLELDFDKLRKVVATAPDVIPAVAQDVDSGRVLIVGYVNEEALQTALKEKVAVFWSTSRNALWIKGATSGDLLELVETRVNCEQNSILYRVRPKGTGACHTREASGKSRPSCYYRVIDGGQLRHVPYEPGQA
ncbi:MAG: phosphoribosyl-AMP cyclohydrolase [Puniceicoccaceae bacterium]